MPPTAVVEIQRGGAGANKWEALAILTNQAHIRMGAIDSGEVTPARQYARDMRTGQLKVVASWLSGEAPTFTSEIETNDVNVQRFLETMQGKNNIRVRYYTGDYGNPANWEKMRVLSNAWNLKPFGAFNTDMVNHLQGFEGSDTPQTRTFPVEADGAIEIDTLTRTNISGTVSGLAINHIISIGYPRYPGQVAGEYEANPGNKEFLAVTSRAGAGGVPRLLYTLDGGLTWTTIQLTGMTDGDGTGVALAGDNVVISMSNTGGGLVWAKWSEIKKGTHTWTRSTNISSGTVVNRVMAVSNTTLYACGNSGAVYKSVDGGITFASAGTAVTANNLTRMAVASENLIWFGGASGTLVRLLNGAMSVVTVTGLSTTAINSLAVPYMSPTRLSQVFVGAANGNVYRTFDGDATTPTWTTAYASGFSAIDGLDFAGPNGDVLFIVQTNASTQSRVVVDYSGGYFGQDIRAYGSFTDPGNPTIDHIAAADHNTAIAVGPVQSSQGYIERIAS